MPVDFMEGLLAIGTGLALVPIVDHVSDHATFRVGFNLREAFLSAILALRPTRALIQTNVVLAERASRAALTTWRYTAAWFAVSGQVMTRLPR
jgi:hypothetical protein